MASPAVTLLSTLLITLAASGLVCTVGAHDRLAGWEPGRGGAPRLGCDTAALLHTCAGILIYMALVDLIAIDFNSDRFRSSLRLQITSYVCLLLGAAAMSVLAIWA